MSGPDLALLVTGGAHDELSQLVRDLGQLGFTNVQAATDPDVALGLILTSSPPVQTLICLLDDSAFASIDFLQQALDYPVPPALLLIHTRAEGELAAAMELAKRMQAEVLGALPRPIDLVRLVGLLNRNNLAPRTFARPQATRMSRLELKETLRETPDIPQLLLHYQPKITIVSGAIAGVESLARWRHPVHGLLGPEEFITVAIQDDLIDQISLRICELAIAQTAAWQRLGVSLRNSINVPLNTFVSADFSGFLAALIHAHQLPASQLALEVAEAQIMQNTADCIEVLNLLRDQHIGLTIDDFGMGSSSLNDLKAVPFNELKIDRSLAHGAARNANQRAILESSLDLARELGMAVVAVGIEDREDWDIVESLGCDMVQGYYCSPPLPADDLFTFYHRWQGPHSSR